MACDGEIAQEEIDLIKSYRDKSHLFDGLDLENRIDEYLQRLKEESIEFFHSLINEITNQNLTTEEEQNIARVSVDMIEADKKVEYSEIAFFKKIRKVLKSSNEVLLEALPESKILPDKEIYVTSDISEDNPFEWKSDLKEIHISLE